MLIAWHLTRMQDWCMAKGEKKRIKVMLLKEIENVSDKCFGYLIRLLKKLYNTLEMYNKDV